MKSALGQLSSRLASVVVRGVLKLVDDSTKAQHLNVGLLAGEPKERIERIQQYGLTSHPEPGAEVVALGIGGNRDHTIIIAVDDRRYRLKNLAEGEVALYDDLGQSVALKRTGVEITSLLKVTLDAPNVEINTQQFTVDASTAILLKSPSIDIGELGGSPVARIGDHVDQNALIDTGSSIVRSN